MRKKMGFLGFFAFLFSMMLFRMVDDDGAGSGTDDIGDFEIEDDVPKKEQQPSTKDIDELKAFKQEIERERAVNSAIVNLTQKYPSFKIDEIAKELQRIAKDEGEQTAEALNNPVGWENLFLTKFKKDKEGNDESRFDRGRGESKELFEFDKALLKARNGNTESAKALFRNSK